MIRVRLNFVPAGGGELEYGMTMDMPTLPRAGDYISVLRVGIDDQKQEDKGSNDFLVRRVMWDCEYPDDGLSSHKVGTEPIGRVTQVYVECEFTLGPFSSESHKQTANLNTRGEPHKFST